MSSDGWGSGDPSYKPPKNVPPRPARLTPEISESILKSLQDRTGPSKGTSEWVTGLSALEQEVIAEAEAQAQSANAAPGVVDMVHEIEKLFDHFTKYSFEFNKSMNFTGPQLEVERPVHVKPGDPRYGSHGQAAFSGRLTIHQWSLVIRGHGELIEGIVMPSEQVLKYQADPDASNHSRFFKLELSSTSGTPMWMVGKKPLPLDELPTFAKQLISSLVRIAKKGKATRTFQFVLTDSAEKSTAPANAPAAETPSPASSMPDRPSSFYEDSTSSLLGSAPGVTGGTMAPPTVPMQPPVPPSPTQRPTPPSPMQPPMPPSSLQQLMPPSPVQRPAPPSPIQPPMSPSPTQPPPPMPQPPGPQSASAKYSPNLSDKGLTRSMDRVDASQSMPQQVPQPPAPRGATVADALEFAYKGMTKELDIIAQTVSQAFGSQNPQLAEQQIARSTKIKDLQEKTKWLLQQWLSVKPEG